MLSIGVVTLYIHTVFFSFTYRPLSKTAEFTSYTETEFNDENQIELAQYIKHLSNKGAKILANNSLIRESKHRLKASCSGSSPSPLNAFC